MAILTSKTALAAPAVDDFLHVVDISDTTSDPAGTSKKATIANIGALFTANKTILINALADFPAPAAGVITLVASTNYVLGDDVSLGTNRLDVSAGAISLTSNSLFGPTLTYTGTGTMITGVDASFSLTNTLLDCPNGKAFDFSAPVSPGTHVVNMDTFNVANCASFGDFDDVGSLIINNGGSLNCDDGAVMAGGNWNVQSFIKFALISTSASFTGIDLGASVSPNIEIANLLFVAPAGGVGVTGAASSANITAGGLGTFRDSSFVGGITPITGIATTDIRWAFDLNSGISDTQHDAMVSLNSNATETVIGTISTPVKVAGTWVVELADHFTADTTGKITYVGERDLPSPIDIVTTVSAASGSNKDITVLLAKNGTVIANSGKTNRVGQNDPKATPVIWRLTLTTNDYLELFVQNDTDTINLIVESAILRAS